MSFTQVRAWIVVALFGGALCGSALHAQAISFLPPVINIESDDHPAGLCVGTQCVVTADFNRDGKLDFAFAGTTDVSTVDVFIGNGNGSFSTGAILQPQGSSFSGGLGALFTGDFNGDGKPDLFVAIPPPFNTSPAQAVIFAGNGDGTFGSPITIGNCALAAVADFNGDGKTDLMCGLTVMLSNGDGSFTNGPTVNAPMDTVILTADFNNDHKVDLLLQQVLTPASVTVYAVALGNGDGTFGPALSAMSFNEIPIAGDFNGDGILDLAGTSDRADAYLTTLFGNGDGTFRTGGQTNVSAWNRGNSLDGFTAAADFNHDGNLDLEADNAIFAGNGDGTFRFPVFVESTVSFPTLNNGYGPSRMYAGDFNGDGLPDLVAVTSYSGMLGATGISLLTLVNDSPGDGFLATGVSAASYTFPVAEGSIVSAFGINLAPQTESASSTPLPTTLGGIRLHLLDSSGNDTLAPLLYVSLTQINYIATVYPVATISVETVGQPYVPKGMTLPQTVVAPGLFSIGNGTAAASAVTVTTGGTVTPVSVTPINLSGGPVYLSLYGTGFENLYGGSSTCTIGNQTVQNLYAGPQGQYQGFDQINLLLPASLAGSGVVPLICTFQDADPTNSVSIDIQ